MILGAVLDTNILMEVHRVLHYPKLQKFIDRENTSPTEIFSKLNPCVRLLKLIKTLIKYAQIRMMTNSYPAQCRQMSVI